MNVAVAVAERLANVLGDRARPADLLARHTSYRIGGPADLFALPDTVEELAAVVRACREVRAPLTLLGAGSNLLVADGGIGGVVVKLGPFFRRVTWEAAGVHAGAAALIGKLARQAAARGMAGIEAAEGIPGTVGGAVVMNAGAYGWETGDALVSVDGVDEAGRVVTLERAALPVRYRRIELPSGFVVTGARFALRADEASAVEARLLAVRDRRVASQPHGASNAGSIFKNPSGDHAGRLIEWVGLKGRRIGRARISDRHANFIVNEGGATASDVQALMSEAQRSVWERSGVWLEPEIRLVGRW